MKTTKHKKIIRLFISLTLVMMMSIGLFPGEVFAPVSVRATNSSIINSPNCSPPDWIPAVPGWDAPNDQKTGSGSVSQDIVGGWIDDGVWYPSDPETGTAEFRPSAYIAFLDGGDAIAVRIRVNGCDGNSSSPEFKNFAFFGFDITGNGAMDFFLGAYNPTGNNGRIGVYLADPALANTAPGNSGITKPIASYLPRAGENYSFIRHNENNKWTFNI